MGLVTEAKGSVRSMIFEHESAFSSSEKKIADQLLNTPLEIVEANISDAAELCGVSEATIVRFCKHIGYTGYYQMKLQLSHDIGRTQRNNATADHSGSAAQKKLLRIAERIRSLSTKLDIDSAKAIAKCINSSSTVHVIGCGLSKTVATEIILRLNNLGFRANGAGEYISEITDLVLADKNESLFCVSKSGETRRVLHAAEIAKEKGIPVLAVTGAFKCPLRKVADHTLSIGVEPEDEPDSNIYLLSAVDSIFSYIRPRMDISDRIESVISESRI